MKIKDILALMPLIGLLMVFVLVVWLLAAPPPGSTGTRTDNMLALFGALITGTAAVGIAAEPAKPEAPEEEQ